LFFDDKHKQYHDKKADNIIYFPYSETHFHPNITMGVESLALDLSTYPPFQNNYKTLLMQYDALFDGIALWQIIAIILSLSITSIEPNNFELQFNSSS
jgi:hypothetical protein